MALFRCDMMSQSLLMHTSFLAVIPEDKPLETMPVVYLLHGLTDNCTGWHRFSRVEHYARQKGVALIMPEVQRSFYTDMQAGATYYTYVSRELPAYCETVFRFSDDARLRYVMGLSMGGYGALKCALCNPERYAGCAAFSSVTDVNAYLDQRRQDVPALAREAGALFGPELHAGRQDDLFALVEDIPAGAVVPPMLLTCGEQDALYDMNRRFDAHLKQHGLPAEYRYWPGCHSWDFWDESVRQAFERFFPPPP